MNFLSVIPKQLLETTITNALLQGLSNPSRRGRLDTTPYQLYQMQHQQPTQPTQTNCLISGHNFNNGPLRSTRKI